MLPPLRKNYSIFVHAIHSRLQLIRNKLDYAPDMEVNEFRERNKKYLAIVKESIRINHDYSVNVAEEYDAAVLFLHTVDQEDVTNQPDWKPKK